MAKNKRKISSTQRDKHAIEVAKYLKQAGIISKKANLHSGQYISRGVLKKVREHEASARLGYRAVKVDKAKAEAAKARGFQVVQGNKIIGPNSPTFRARIKSGALTGVRPVKGGMLEEVDLPHTVYDMATLVDSMESGLDTLKLPEEYFAFSIGGNESWRVFENTQLMLDYLRTYKGIFDERGSLKFKDNDSTFEKFKVIRLSPADRRLLPNVKQRRKRAAERYKEGVANGTIVPQKRTSLKWREKLELMHPAQAERVRAKAANKAAIRRAKETPAQAEMRRQKNRDRMAAKRGKK